MFIGDGAGLERELHGAQHGLLVVMQHEREDLDHLDHLAIAARVLAQPCLQSTERLRQLREGRAVA